MPPVRTGAKSRMEYRMSPTLYRMNHGAGRKQAHSSRLSVNSTGANDGERTYGAGQAEILTPAARVAFKRGFVSTGRLSSLITQCVQRIDRCGTSCREPRGEQANGEQPEGRGYERERVDGLWRDTQARGQQA